jgi:hypothetical protein
LTVGAELGGVCALADLSTTARISGRTASFVSLESIMLVFDPLPLGQL